ncbi:LacI family DNA-binding transcriptional regulator [Clavibacter michiganensis]|uniref:LacI family DNA-binding transcriptional regulator n=1 Tax=Clavibacter michiganensis TaxID=28447 RepID=UPI000A3ACB90|nr:LacI family DNA-binding transcriptional regulator [Clavibacter michiganensis]MWJ05175.1 LacI family transcriptional regulator [Clavibacter michiganensis subsp. michiganensis]MWJ11194.1 LacI family transcriptional regulator [Clavibacter michiganensis subsp. michiganensis]MWJ23561.1 LacI family transcriptional regulator [Clavibacter michiganensis subsp. michiganensis]MWJ46208.1 LacI family transcriptional regulator [Clavibacter michiganensis subsp. michiganensis]QIT13151.1 LacI family DNA-bin
MNGLARPAVLADVAELSGVSLSTVSRVLTGRTPVHPVTRDRVERAVAELDYRPNAAAQALVSGRSTMVAVLAANTLRWGFAATLQGIEEAARAAGYTVMIAVAESDNPNGTYPRGRLGRHT